MKAKFKLFVFLVATFIFTLTAGIIAGCAIGESDALYEANSRGMTASVTYYANGGKFSAHDMCYMCLRYVPGTPIMDLGNDASDLEIKRTGYVFTGWQYCELKDGLPILTDEKTGEVYAVREETGTAYIQSSSGKELAEIEKRFNAAASGEDVFVDGNHPVIGENEHLYLAAVWVPDVRIEYKLVSDTGSIRIEKDVVGEDGKAQTVEVEVKNGETLDYKSFGRNDSIGLYPSSVTFRTLSTHSYIHLYEDKECTKIINDGQMFDKPGDGNNLAVYAKFLEGFWTPVRNSAGVNSMLEAVGGGTNYFVVQDIEYSGTFTDKDDKGDFKNYSKTKTDIFNGVIDGNNKCISNISVSRSTITTDQEISLFGRIGASAEIKNLTLKNVKLNFPSVRAGANITLYALFTHVANEAKLSNITVDGVELNVDLTYAAGASINNINKLEGGGYNTNSWLYGMYDSDKYRADSEFVKIYPDVKVLNPTLTINNENVLGGQHE